MNAEKIIRNRFIQPFVGKTSNNVGAELEYPLINESGGDIDVEFAASVLKHFEAHGFHCVLFGTHGEKLFMENDDGDCVSFDNSYNNFEFSMQYGDNLCAIYDRYRRLFYEAQNYFARESHSLIGRGTNPNFHNISVNHVPFATYDMVRGFLHDFPGAHGYPDFPAFLSSVQTHLDVSADILPCMYTLFTRLDFVRALLFANSPDFDGRGYRIFRDYLWEKSGFSNCPGITGKVDESFETVDDIVSFFLKKGMFNRIRNGKYEYFKPVPIKEYFENPKYGARAEDVECYLSFRSVEITSRGTLEVRGDCTQPLDRPFSPPAFNLGILNNAQAAKARLNRFFEDNPTELTNSELRNIVAEGGDLDKIAPEREREKLLSDMADISLTALKKRGKGEEKLLILA